jgi:hypothetical protein
MRGNSAQFSGPDLRRSIKIDLNLFALEPAKLLQNGDQFHFVVYGVQAQAQLGDQVMSIDQVRHDNLN